MATVVALTAFHGWLKRDELGPSPKDKNGKTLDREAMGWAPGLPAHDPYGTPIQDVKEGEQVKFFEGQLVDSNHPAVKKWPSMFGQPKPTP